MCIDSIDVIVEYILAVCADVVLVRVVRLRLGFYCGEVLVEAEFGDWVWLEGCGGWGDGGEGSERSGGYWV